MLPSTIQTALVIDHGLNAIRAVVGPEHIMLVDPSSPLGETAQLGILLLAAIVVNEIAEAAGPIANRARRTLPRWWRRWRKRR